MCVIKDALDSAWQKSYKVNQVRQSPPNQQESLLQKGQVINAGAAGGSEEKKFFIVSSGAVLRILWIIINSVYTCTEEAEQYSQVYSKLNSGRKN